MSSLKDALESTIKMRNASEKILYTAVNLHQWLLVSKSYTAHTSRIERITNLINGITSVKSLSDKNLKIKLLIKDFTFPIIWQDENKKKFSGSFFCYFTFAYDENIVDTKVCEVSTNESRITFSKIELNCVYPNTDILVKCYYYIPPPGALKCPIKMKSPNFEDILLKFVEFGSLNISVKELISEESPSKLLKFTYNEAQLKAIQAANQSGTGKKSQAPQLQLYGDFLYKWRHVSGAFYFYPDSDSFVPLVKGSFKRNTRKFSSCVVFQKNRLHFFENKEILFEKPILTMDIKNLKIQIIPGKGKIYCIKESSSDIVITAEIDFDRKVHDFSNFLTHYQEYYRVYGDNLVFNSNLQTVHDAVKDILKDQAIIIQKFPRPYMVREV